MGGWVWVWCGVVWCGVVCVSVVDSGVALLLPGDPSFPPDLLELTQPGSNLCTVRGNEIVGLPGTSSRN